MASRFFFLALGVLLSACGNSDDKALASSASACSVEAPSTLRLGQTAQIKLKISGLSSDVGVAGGKMTYRGDSSGGLRAADDTNPIGRNFGKISVSGDTATVGVTYSIKSGPSGSMEERYFRRYPGGIDDVFVVSSGSSSPISCSFSVELKP